MKPFKLITIKYNLSASIILSLMFILLLSSQVHGQNSGSDTTSRRAIIEMQNELMDQSRKQRTWGGILLGTGIVGTALNGLAVANGGSLSALSFGQDQFQDYDGSVGLVIGAVVVVSGIALLNAGNKTLVKAIRLGWKLEDNYLRKGDTGLHHLKIPHNNSSGLLAKYRISPGINLTYTF